MIQFIIQALKFAGPAAIGFVSSDLINWLGSVPGVGPFFRSKNSQGETPWYVSIIGIVGLVAVVLFVLKKIFKVKIL